MTSLLVTTTSEKQVDAAVVWDPLGGNPVASLSGELASKASITGFFGGVACSTARKPTIQMWNFHSATGSGCLIGILEGSHSAKICEMKLANWDSNGPALLVSADIVGFLACWSLGSLVRGISMVSSQSAGDNEPQSNTNISSMKHSPLWYVIQASTSHPVCTIMADTVVVAGSQGLKVS
ncbi:unnamed protein product [Trichobilharzia regenti]|nr:unnamed protein product [Trichobilharzia regenti]